MTPAGLASVQPGFLRRVIALYALLAVFALGVRPAAMGAAADAPGR